MENRLCCLLRRLVAFTFRRLYKPPPFKHMTNSIPNGNLSCLIQRKNNKYRAIFITKLTKQGKTQKITVGKQPLIPNLIRNGLLSCGHPVG